MQRWMCLLLLTACLGFGPPAATVARKLDDLPGIHNLLQAAPRIYCGSEPHVAEGFASLARLGVKTLVSVDGARPKLALAKAHGLRYVHIPIGYDGVLPKAGQSLARLVREAEGPIYLHCHHGQHRGPAAAAVACLAANAVTKQQAQQILEQAGTGANYPGLWRDVASYRPPAKETALPELVETAEVESFAAAMAKIDRNFDNLKLCRKADWSVPQDHPDLVATQEALILTEGLREAARNLAGNYDPRFRAWLRESEQQARAVEDLLRTGRHAAAGRQFERLEQSCRTCHNAYRNGGE